MKVCVFGLGYVGCVSLGCLARNGHEVIGVDINPTKTDLINRGKATIVESEIGEILREQKEAGRISATLDSKSAVAGSDVSIICVGTPSTPEGHLDLSFIENTARQIGEGLRSKDGFHWVVIRSTVLPGTNRRVGKLIEEASDLARGAGFSVVSNPEFLREGSAVKDFFHPPMTVMGSDFPGARAMIEDLYRGIEAPIEETTIEVAEIIKYVNNSFHALKIVFANEVGNICKKAGIDSHRLMELFCRDTKLNISPTYLKPGMAYGGSCLPKDLKALKTMAHDYYMPAPVIEAVELSNTRQKEVAFELIEKRGVREVGILGLSFKQGTDDLRYSPMVELAERLIGRGYRVLIHDEKVNLSKLVGANREYIEKRIPHIADLILDDLDSVVGNSRVIVIAHRERQYLDCIDRFPDKFFIDFVRVTDDIGRKNYEGIGW